MNPFYQWYAQRFQGNIDDSGTSSQSAMSEADWNKLTPDQQARLVQTSTVGMDSVNDPELMQRFYQAVGQRPGYNTERGLTLVDPSWDESAFTDAGRVFRDPTTGQRWTDAENLTPGMQNQDGAYFGSRPWLTGIGTVVGMGLINNALMAAQAAGNGGLFGGGAASSGAPELMPSITPSTVGSNMLDGSQYLFNLPEGAEALGAAGWAPGAGPTAQPWGMLAPGMENSALLDSWLINNGMPQLAGGALTNMVSPGGLGQNASSLFGSALKNPLQALGLIQAGSSLFSGGNGGGKGGGGTGVPGGSGNPGSGIKTVPYQRTPFKPNPYTQQQIQNFRPVGGGR